MDQRILFVDEDASLRRLMQLVFERLGAAADFAGNPGDALDFLAGTTYGIVITDWKFGETTSGSVIDALASLDPKPLVILTGWPGAGDEFRDGAVDLIYHKPYDPHALGGLTVETLRTSDPTAKGTRTSSPDLTL